MATFHFCSLCTYLAKKDKKEENKYDLQIFHIKISITRHFSKNLTKITQFWLMKKKERTVLSLFDYLPDKDGKKRLMPKMKMKIKKIWENEFNFWSLHIKISLYDNFYENLKKIDHFLRYFWLIEAKGKLKMIQFGKMSLIFEFFWSKLGYMAIFIKISEKRNRLIFKKVFFTNQSKKWGCR